MVIRVEGYTANERLTPRNRQQVSVPGATPDAFGASVGRGMQTLAAGVNSVAGALQYVKDQKAAADARFGVDAYRQAARDTMYDPSTGYLNQTGGNALGEARAKAEQELARRRDEIAAGLTPEARKLFDDAASGVTNATLDNTIRHESAQLRDYTMGSFEAAATGALQDAIRNSDDQRKFDAGLHTALEEARQAGELAGMSPEEMARKAEEISSSAHAGRVMAFAQEDPIAAFTYLEAYRGEIDVDTYNKLHSGLEGAYYSAQARGWVSENNVTGAGAYRYAPTSTVPVYRSTIPVDMSGVKGHEPNGQLSGIVASAVETVLGSGARVSVSSAHRPGDAGSQHADGGAMDFAIYDESGAQLRWDDPRVKQVALVAASMGILGFGAGPKYMGGNNFHFDLGDGAVNADGVTISHKRGGVTVWSDDPQSSGPGAAEWYSDLAAAAQGGAGTVPRGAPATAKPGSDYLGVPAFIAGPESSGDPNAYNKTSGAAGLVQFMPDTYLGLVRQMNPEWAQGMTRDQILATRMGSENMDKWLPVYQRFRAQNAATLRNAGIAITPASEYVAHHFGAGGAVTFFQLLAEGRGNESLAEALSSKGIPGATWASQNPWMRGITVAGALQWFNNKTSAAGSGYAGGPSAGTVSPALAMEQALAIENPKLRAAVLDELQLRMRVEEQASAYRDKQVADQAWSIIDNGGTPDDIPLALQMEVGVQTMNTIFDSYERRTQGVDVTNEGRYLELYDMATSTDKAVQDAFLKLDLNLDRPNLSQGDLRTMKVFQTEMRDGRAAAAADGPASVSLYDDSDFRGANGDLEQQYTAAVGAASAAKLDEAQRRQLADLQLRMRQAMGNFADKEGRKMSFEERSSFASTLMAPVVIEGVNDGWFGGGTPMLFQVPDLTRDGQGYELQYSRGDVPVEVEREIGEQLTKAFGRPPTEDEIVEQYENELLLSLGMSPSFEYRDIDRKTRKALQEQYPDASPEELVDLFRTLTLEAANRLLVE